MNASCPANLTLLRLTKVFLAGAAAFIASAAFACSLVDLDRFTSAPDTAPSLENDEDGGREAGDSPAPEPAPSDGGDSYAAVVLADAPIAYFRMEEEPGAMLIHDELRRVEGRAQETVEFGTPGIAGRAVSLGNQSGFDLGDVFDFDGKVPFALEAWVKLKTRSWDQLIFRKRGGSPERGYIVYVEPNRTVHFEAWGASMSAWTDAPLPDDFAHVVVSVSYATGKGNATLWVNGQRAPNGGFDNTSDLANTQVPLLIGHSVDGVIDEVALYDHELTQDRVRAHHQAGLGGR